MKFFVNLAQVSIGDMSIDLGGGDVGVAEKALDSTQISTID